MTKIDLRDVKGPIDVETFCKGLQAAGEDHKRGYFHYTRWSNFVKMGTPVLLPNDKKRRVWLLNPASDKNDLTEGKIDKRIWYASFAYGPREKVPMWMTYGRYSPDAVRIKIDSTVMLKWYRKKAHAVYGVTKNPKGEMEYEDVSALLEWVHLIDVGYVADELAMHDEGACVKHHGKEYSMRPCCFQDMTSGRHKKWAPHFKKAGWAYEQEVRLLFKFHKPLDYAHLAVDFDEPLQSVLSDPQSHLVRSPWLVFEKSNGVSILDAQESDYCGEIR